MASGLVASLMVFAVGAILDFAVTASPNQHGVNLNTIGVILMIVGVVGGPRISALLQLRCRWDPPPPDRGR